MNQIEIGKLIAQKRIEKGLTQKQLAECLFVTDKAVSKWERGLSSPDLSIINKVSSILDVDVELLVQNSMTQHKWVGRLILNNNEFYKEKVGQYPLINHLVGYFLLVGIRKIEIITNDIEYIEKLQLEKFDLSIKINDSFGEQKIFEINDNFFLFGANLTRIFRYMMSSESNIKTTFLGKEMPIRFLFGNEEFSEKTFGRGYFYLKINSTKDIEDANKFVNIVQAHNPFLIGNLDEINRLRSESKLLVDR